MQGCYALCRPEVDSDESLTTCIGMVLVAATFGGKKVLEVGGDELV